MTMLMRRSGRRGSSGGGGVTPPPAGVYGYTATDPVAWWKNDTLSGLADGAAVATWPDSGPNGYDLTLLGGSVTYDFGDGTGYHGVKFNGGVLFNAALHELLSVANFTVFVSVRYDTQDNSRVTLQQGDNAWDFGLISAPFSNNYMGWGIGGGGGDSLIYFNPLPAVPQGKVTYAEVFDGTQTGNDNRIQIYAGISQLFSGSGDFQIKYGGTVPAVTGSSGTGFSVGGDTGGGSTIKCHIAEIVIFDSTLSVDDVLMINTAIDARHS